MNTGSFTPNNKELLSKGWGPLLSVPSKYATEIKHQYHNRILIIPDNRAIGTCTEFDEAIRQQIRDIEISV